MMYKFTISSCFVFAVHIYACSSHFDGIGKLDVGGSGVKAVGGPPVHGLYDHHSLSPPKASTPLLRGE